MRDDDAWIERDNRAIDREAMAYKRERFEPAPTTNTQSAACRQPAADIGAKATKPANRKDDCDDTEDSPIPILESSTPSRTNGLLGLAGQSDV